MDGPEHAPRSDALRGNFRVPKVWFVAVLIGAAGFVGVVEAANFLYHPNIQAPQQTNPVQSSTVSVVTGTNKVCGSVPTCSTTITSTAADSYMVIGIMQAYASADVKAVGANVPITFSSLGTEFAGGGSIGVYIYGGWMSAAHSTVTLYVNLTIAEYYAIDSADYSQMNPLGDTGTAVGKATSLSCTVSSLSASSSYEFFWVAIGATTGTSTYVSATGTLIGQMTVSTDNYGDGQYGAVTASATSESVTASVSGSTFTSEDCVAVALLDAAVPTAPGTPSASSVTTTSMTVAWTLTTSQTGYYTAEGLYEDAGVSSCPTPAAPPSSPWTEIETYGSPYTTTSQALTGLTTGEGYCFAVSVSNTTGAVSSSALYAPTLTAAPGNPTGSVYATTSMTVSWTAPSETPASIVTAFTLYQATGSTCSGGSTTGEGTSLSASITGLTAATEYTFEVSATDSSGTSAYSACESFYTVPSAPTGLTETVGAPTTTTVIQMSWTAPSGTVSSYTALDDAAVNTCTGASFTSYASGISGSPYTTSTLGTGEGYCFEIEAVTSPGGGTGAAPFASAAA